MEKHSNDKPVVLLKVELFAEMRARFKSQVALIGRSQKFVLGRLIEAWTTSQEQKRINNGG